GLAVRRTFGSALAGAADVVAETGRQAAGIGDVDALLASASVAALVRADFGRLGWESGVGVRAGVARLAGRGSVDPLAPVRGAAVTAPWGGPLAVVRGQLTLPRRCVLSLAVEGGWVSA